ncbi:MAG: magnesium/cobalt transporter CorA [Deltaproteobacteria bacterium]|nr:magnesium/cobalt transporter CorA [Deltaproteobacteria bacterium]
MARKKQKQPRLRIGGRRQREVGAVPGTLRADPTAEPSKMRVIAYGPNKLHEAECSSIAEVAVLQRKNPKVLWLDVRGLADVELLRQIGEHFGLHRLALEDVLSTEQRPKVEPYEEADFAVLRMAQRVPDRGLDIEQVSFFLGDGFVITFQEREGDVFDPIRSRIREARGRIRTAGADYLLYALLDSVVDSVFPLIEEISIRLEDEEERILRGTDDEPVIESLYEVRRELIMLRRALWPLREAIGQLERVEGTRVSDDTRVYLRDVADHAVQIVDLLESEREVVSTLMDVHLSQVSHKMNEVMKVLTIIATIFIPLGFLAGVYGMNFDTDSPYNMPELDWRFGYPALITVMLLIGVGMLFFFRRKKWL